MRTRLLRFMSRRAKDKKRGRDGTKYSKFHPENYLSHHLSAISMAAVYADACHIDDGVTGLKQDAGRARGRLERRGVSARRRSRVCGTCGFAGLTA